MNWVGFYSLGNAWVFAMAAPVVLFYFLKLKRPRVQVPSLLLWRRVLKDRRVNSPFQKFKRNLLLLMQLLALCMLALAAMRPFWKGRQERARWRPILIDTSASMAAVDSESGTTRLALAVERAKDIVDGLGPDEQVCIIAFDSTARRLTDFTGNARILRGALQKLHVRDVPSRLQEVLRMTAALGQAHRLDEVVMFTDGNVPERVHLDLPFELDFQVLPSAGPNIGITALNARRSGPGGWAVFVGVEAGGKGQAAASLQVYGDGERLATRYVSLSAGEHERVGFAVSGDRAMALEVRLAPEGFDSLASDNVAYLRLKRTRPLRACVAPDLPTFRHALVAMEGVAVCEPEAGARRLEYDLLVSDRREDGEIAATTALFAGIMPDDLADLVTTVQQGTAAVDWERAAPLLQHVELAEVAMLERPVSAQGVSAADYEAKGYQILAHGEAGPLILRRSRAARIEYVLLFHPERSTLPYRVAFPVMMANLVYVALDQAGLAEAHALRTGALGPLAVEPDSTYRVTGPDAESRTAAVGQQGLLSGIPAPRVGYYQIEGPGNDTRVGAALLSPEETGLASAPEIEFDGQVTVATAASDVRKNRSLWPWLAALAFVALSVEWWYFNHGATGRVG